VENTPFCDRLLFFSALIDPKADMPENQEASFGARFCKVLYRSDHYFGNQNPSGLTEIMLKSFALILTIAFILANICNFSGSVAFSAQTSKYRADAGGASTSALSENKTTWQPSFASLDGSYSQLVIGVNKTCLGANTTLPGLVGQVGGKIVDTVSMGGVTVAVVADVPPSNYSLLGKMAKLNGLARYVEPRMKFRVQFEPNDPLYSFQWALPKIEANWAWNTTKGNSSLLIAIVDTGIDYTHPDLASNYVALGYDWIHNNANPLDDNGHGTHVAGIIAAVMNNGIGVAGLAQVKIMAEKALNSTGWGDEVDLANAITDAVTKGARILSNSWGGDSESELIHDAIRYAYNQGVLVVAAAGNSIQSTLFYPAAYSEVISVAATDEFDSKAYFSNWGDWIELSAPGVDIYSTMPTYHVTLNDEGYASNYDYMSGTSMACPQVAGVAALVWSSFPNASRDWVREQLRSSADDMGFHPYFGYGRINARKAVEQAPSAHDVVLYSYETSRHVQPGDEVLFNVTVFNFGLSSESDVGVQLLVDSVQTDSVTVSSLPSGSYSDVTLAWRPLSARMYNITFYVVPVPGQTNAANNVFSLAIEAYFLVTVDPTSGPVGTTVTVNGRDFSSNGSVAVSFNDMFIGAAFTDSSGNFAFTFNIPVCSAEVQLVKASDLSVAAQANFTVVDVAPLNVQVDTGAVHFRSETVTFYVQTVFKGQAVSAAITTALLYKPDGTSEALTAQALALGLHRVTYELPNDAQTGLYALSVTANYTTDTVESVGAFFKSFLVSETLSGWNAVLVEVNGTIGMIKTDLGMMEVNLNQINATLQAIHGDMATLVTSIGTIQTGLDVLQVRVLAINGTTATLQTVLGSVNGTVTTINDQMATILIPKVGQVEANITALQETREAWTTPQYIILSVALTAAVAAIISVAVASRKKQARSIEPKESAPEPNPSIQNPDSSPPS
jgi:thermitase